MFKTVRNLLATAPILKKAMPYSFEIIQEITDTPINIFNYELFIKTTIDTMKIKYTPQLEFGGSLSECVKLN